MEVAVSQPALDHRISVFSLVCRLPSSEFEDSQPWKCHYQKKVSDGIGSTTSTRRLCDLSSAGKFGRGEAEAKLSKEDKSHNLRVDVVDPASTTDITSKSSYM